MKVLLRVYYRWKGLAVEEIISNIIVLEMVIRSFAHPLKVSLYPQDTLVILLVSFLFSQGEEEQDAFGWRVLFVQWAGFCF